MIRSVAVVAVLCALISAAGAQAPAPAPPVPAAKAAVGKPPPKSRPAAKRTAPAESGPCQIGVISAIGDRFAVQEVGLTIFGNELTDVPIEDWGFDDLVVARVRAVVPGVGVRKIAYPKAVFTPYEHPAPTLFRNARDELTAIVRQVTANAGCERYLAVTRGVAQIAGTNQTTHGIGVVRTGTRLFPHAALFANFQLTMFDGKTFAAHDMPRDFGAALARSLRLTGDPLETLDADDFPEPPAKAASSAVLRDRMRTLLSARLDETLPRILNQE
jgi:hypothetical protein